MFNINFQTRNLEYKSNFKNNW